MNSGLSSLERKIDMRLGRQRNRAAFRISPPGGRRDISIGSQVDAAGRNRNVTGIQVVPAIGYD